MKSIFKSKVESQNAKSVFTFYFCVLILTFCVGVSGQSTEFSYQGRLLDNSLPPTANYDFEFSLWDSLANGNQVGSTQTLTAVAVTSGVFNIKLDFGANFPGAARFLEIHVRPAGGGAFTTLAPRQAITSGPYAIRSLNSSTADTAINATTANNTLNLGGVAANQYVVTTDPRMTDDRNPQPNSGNYIQNQNASPQSLSNFNISGNGQANAFDAATQFKLGGTRILSNAGTRNLFAGEGTGQANTSGGRNSFFGYQAGNANTTGDLNSFFGNGAGQSNLGGRFNDFFGDSAGLFNTSGSFNSFFGSQSGNQNTGGSNNTFIGNYAGQGNTVGNGNTMLGFQTNVANPGLTNATAIGANARVDASNSLVLGSINGVNQATADTNVGIGTTTPSSRLHVVGDGLFSGNLTVNGSLTANLSLNTINANTQYNLNSARVLSNSGANNFFAGQGTGQANTSGFSNSFFGNNAGQSNTSGSSNSFFGDSAGRANVSGLENSFFGSGAGIANQNGSDNAFFGFTTGRQNVSGSNNSFFGYSAGYNNTNGFANSYFGYNAGLNCNGGGNSFFGQGAGFGANTCTGSNNNFFGQNTGQRLTNGNGNSAFGQSAGGSIDSGYQNSFFGFGAGSGTTSGFNNVFVGQSTGGFNTTGTENTAIGSNAWMGSANLTNATAIGANSCVTASDSLVLGGITNCGNPNGRDTKVGIGTSAPTARLHVVGDGLFTGNLTVNGTLTANIAPGNANYIQNTTTQQATSNFNISGNGTAGGTLSGNAVNAATQFNIGGSRVLVSDSNANVFAGFDAGSFNSTGSQNTFIGLQSGGLNNAGSRNTFLGFQAGQVNTTGSSNTAIGRRADVATSNLDYATAIGADSIVSSSNTVMLGRSAGQDAVQVPGNLTVGGTFNAGTDVSSGTQYNIGTNRVLSVAGPLNRSTFVGVQAGAANPSGESNSFFGWFAGGMTTGSFNSFFGSDAGGPTTTGSLNSAFGTGAGRLNTFGNNNTFFGAEATTGGLSVINNATAVGANAEVDASNALVLGSINGVNGATADTNIGIGTTTPTSKLQVVDSLNTGLRVQTNTPGGTVASFGGNGSFQVDSFGAPGGRLSITENGDVGIGTNSPATKLQVAGDGSFTGNVFIGTTTSEKTLQVSGGVLSAGTQAGFRFRERGSTSSSDDWTWYAFPQGQGHKAALRQGFQDVFSIDAQGVLVANIFELGRTFGGGQQSLCRDVSNFIADCSSSLRYKTNIASFSSGLSFIRQLRPISFDWKSGGMHDIGFGAEDVAKISPLFVTFNKDGQIEGVKYDRLSTVFVNAFKEQQKQIEQQEEQIKRQVEAIRQQQTQIDALKRLVCVDHPKAAVCK